MEGVTNGKGEGDNEMGESKDREMEERKGAGQKGEVRKEEEDLSTKDEAQDRSGREDRMGGTRG